MSATTKTFSVGFFDCDAFAYLRISKLCEYFQETALAQLKNQGLDYLSMIKKDKYALMISRIKLRISHLPLWGEEIAVSTWLKGFKPEKVGWNDYDVRDSRGNSIIQATSSWLLVDLNTGKAVPFAGSPYNFEVSPELSALPSSIELLEPQGMPRAVLVKTVKYSEIDLNYHVNNCKYSDWVLDAITMDELKSRRIRSIQLNYMQQVSYDEKVVLMRFPESRHHIIIFGVNEEHPELVHFQARVGFDKPFE